jgi:hypothetical protein
MGHRSTRRWRFLGLLAIGALVVAGLATPAYADDELPIVSGSVFDSEGLLAGVCVDVYDTNGDWVAGAEAYDGTYSVWVEGGDFAADYYVQFSTDACSNDNYLPEWYDGATTQSEATAVRLGDTGIDATLVPGTTISGTVTVDGGEVPELWCVSAYDSTNTAVSSADGSGDGSYTIGRLVPGEQYKLLFSTCGSGNYTSAWYDDATDFDSATAVTATAEGVTGIDQDVPTGGRILGAVTDDQGQPVDKQVCIEVYDASKPFVQDGYATTSVAYPWANPGLDPGDFEVYGLVTGDYKLRFWDCDDAGIGPEWYQDTFSFAKATSVHVTVGQDTTGITAVVGPPDTVAPQTTLTSGPAPGSTIHAARATFGFSSSEADSTFECKLDAADFTTCTSPRTVSGLTNGVHTLAVRATDPSGNVDASPATRTFTVELADPRCAPARASLGKAKRAVQRDTAHVKSLKKKRVRTHSDKQRKALAKKIAQAQRELAQDRRTVDRLATTVRRVC